jgi:hypothetical protein
MIRATSSPTGDGKITDLKQALDRMKLAGADARQSGPGNGKSGSLEPTTPKIVKVANGIRIFGKKVTSLLISIPAKKFGKNFTCLLTTDEIVAKINVKNDCFKSTKNPHIRLFDPD